MKYLPDGWDFVQLNKIADIIRGVSYDGSDSEKEDGEGYASILRAGNIGSSITYDDLVYVPERYVSQEQYLKAGDILIATSSGSKHIVGKAAQIKNDKKISFGAFCCVIRPKKVDPEYLNSYFQSKHYKSFVQKTLRGANINNLRISQIRVLEIPLPTLPTQKKIAAVLEKAEKLREWRKEADGLTDRFLKSTFLEMFGDPASNPKGWIVSNLENELSDDTQNGLYKPETNYGNGVPILRIDSFYDGQISNIEKLKRLKCTKDEIEKFKLQIGDILINRVNSLEYLGKCGLVKFLIEDTVYESNMMRIRPKPEKLNPTFLAMFLCTQYIKNQILGCAKKAVNQASINQKDVNSFKILVPPLPLQEKFASIVQQVEQIREHQTQSRQHIENFFNVLMQRAFRGELEAR